MKRELEPEYMDTEQEASDYAAMDHDSVNQAVAEDFCGSLERAGLHGPQHVVDLGTGPGDIPLRLVTLRPELRCTGVDAAATMLKLARKAGAGHPHGEQITWLQADVKRLPMEDNSVDAVFSNTILHHIPEPIAMLEECVRILRPGGLCFIRDLYRPEDLATADALVGEVCGDAPASHKSLFLDSLKAGLTVAEMETINGQMGWSSWSVAMTSNRHWTMEARA